jgi:beta-lactamase regulating signal transducer with metallopeptidase domain
VNTHLLLEAAARSLVMGAIVFVVLRVMRIDQVRARRTAWLLALVGALAMPALVGAQIGPRLLPDFAATRPQAAGVPSEPYIPTPSTPSIYRVAVERQTPRIDEERGQSGQFTSTVLSLAVIGYCAVAAVLSLRLCTGIGFALRLRNQAERVIFPFDPELDVRSSSRIATPVTIGSSVLLPSGYTAWDTATLRIVLSHERAHVRQADFFVHALAGLHCALFWFNPFSWWLQRQLSELG